MSTHCGRPTTTVCEIQLARISEDASDGRPDTDGAPPLQEAWGQVGGVIAQGPSDIVVDVLTEAAKKAV